MRFPNPPAARRHARIRLVPARLRAALPTLALVFAVPVFGQDTGESAPDSAPAPQVDVGPPPTIESTESMDPAVVELIEERVAAVEAAPGDVEKRRELALAYESNTIKSLAEKTYDQVVEMDPDATQWRFRRGVVRFANGDLDGALEDLGAAAEAFKNTPVVQARYGDVLRMAGELEESEAAWRQAIAAEENQTPTVKYPQTRAGLAQVLLDLERPEDAEKFAREAIEIDPSYRHAHFVLGLALRDLGRDDEANVALNIGTDSYPGFPPDPHQVRLDEAARGYSRRMMIIENLAQAQAYGEAQKRLDKVLAERPDDHMVLNLGARIALRTGDVQTAREYIDKSLEIAPEEPTTHLEACLLELRQAEGPSMQMNQIAQAMQMGQEIPPAQVEQVRQAGLVSAEKAVEHATQAVMLAPLVGRHHFWLGMSQQILGSLTADPQQQRQLQQAALGAMQQAARVGCVEPGFDMQIAQMYRQVGQFPQMKRHVLRHIEANSRDPQALWMLIEVLRQERDGVPSNKPERLERKVAEVETYTSKLERLVTEAKDVGWLQNMVRLYLTDRKFEDAERVLAKFEEAAAGNPQAAQFVVSVDEFIRAERAKDEAPAPAPEGAGGQN